MVLFWRNKRSQGEVLTFNLVLWANSNLGIPDSGKNSLWRVYEYWGIVSLVHGKFSWSFLKSISPKLLQSYKHCVALLCTKTNCPHTVTHFIFNWITVCLMLQFITHRSVSPERLRAGWGLAFNSPAPSSVADTKQLSKCWLSKIFQNFLGSRFAYHPTYIQELFGTLREEI